MTNNEKTKMINKGIAFNVLDPYQVELYEHAMRFPNFSAYIKRLIYLDIQKTQSVPSQPVVTAPPVTDAPVTAHAINVNITPITTQKSVTAPTSFRNESFKSASYTKQENTAASYTKQDTLDDDDIRNNMMGLI